MKVMENALEKLFESQPKVRILRMLLRNPEDYFTFPEIVRRTQLKKRAVKKEMAKFLKMGLAKTKKSSIQYEVRKKSRKRGVPLKIILKSRKAKVYFVNPEFELVEELRNLITKSSVASRKKLANQVKGLGRVRLAVVAGIFLNRDSSRTDLLIVGDKIKRRRFENFLLGLESELGQELNYTLMSGEEFKYRWDMYDKFLRDLLEYPHEKLVNKLKV